MVDPAPMFLSQSYADGELVTSRTISARNGMFEVDVREAGLGAPLLYLHGIWDGEDTGLIERLARRFRVVAPRLPGFGGSTGESHLGDIHDVIYYYLDVLDAIDLRGAALVGHCLGGMFAAELAAVQPERFSKLVLIAPFGLWDNAHPVPDFFAGSPNEVAALLGRPAPAATPAAEDGDARIAAALAQAKSMSAAARFLWPLPNHGLKDRAHRISAPTLLLWGTQDGISPPAYGRDFQQLIHGARLELIAGAGHVPHEQQPDKVAGLIGGFLG